MFKTVTKVSTSVLLQGVCEHPCSVLCITFPTAESITIRTLKPIEMHTQHVPVNLKHQQVFFYFFFDYLFLSSPSSNQIVPLKINNILKTVVLMCHLLSFTDMQCQRDVLKHLLVHSKEFDQNQPFLKRSIAYCISTLFML